MRRNVWIGVITAAAAVLAVVAVIVFVTARAGYFTPKPVPSGITLTPLPGDGYIDRTVTNYLNVLASGNAARIQRLNGSHGDAGEIRSAAFGRYAAAPFTHFSVRSVKGEQMLAPGGDGLRAQGWVAVATVALTQSGKVHTFDIKVSGSYGVDGTADNAEAVAAAN